MLFWTSVKDLVNLTDSELDRWKSYGVGGFHFGVNRLNGMGGTNEFSGDPTADLSGKEFELQRKIQKSGVVQRAKDRGLKLYMGVYLTNYFNTSTPLKEWFDDAGWQGVVLPQMQHFAAAAKLLGFDGITFDQELYPQTGNVTTATWKWNYPGNTRTEEEVRAKVAERGRQLMSAILKGYPDVELTVYHFQFPGTYNDVVQERVNKKLNPAEAMLFADFWSGMTSVEGYRAVRFIQALFYKDTHGGGWDAAFQYEMNGFHAMASQRFANWSYAASRVYLSPFSWINGIPAKNTGYSAPRSPNHVATQLAAFHKWGMGREVANFCYGGLKSFDYSPYVPGLKAATTPAVVDREAPRLEVISPSAESTKAEGDAVNIAGWAHDNLAVRAVRWSNGDKRGAAQMTWKINSGDHKRGYDWQMNWTADEVPLNAGENTIAIEVEDIKGLKTAKTVWVTRR